MNTPTVTQALAGGLLSGSALTAFLAWLMAGPRTNHRTKGVR